MVLRIDNKLSPLCLKTASNMARLKPLSALLEMIEVEERDWKLRSAMVMETSAMAKPENQKKSVVLVLMVKTLGIISRGVYVILSKEVRWDMWELGHVKGVCYIWRGR